MNEKESLQDAIDNGFYRINDGTKIIITNFDNYFNFKDYCFTYQHFKLATKKGEKDEFYYLDMFPDREPWPLVKPIIDFEKPYGKLKGEPYFNLFKGFPIKPEITHKDTSILWNHIDYLTSESPQATEWVKDWIADIFQNPNKKPGTFLIFRGGQGTGKGLFFDVLMKRLLGDATLSTPNSVISNRFNGAIRGKLLINLNEGSWDSSRSDVGKIKSFITDPQVEIELKGKEVRTYLNPTRVVMTTNSDWVLKTDNDDRRSCIIETPEKKDSVYYNNLAKAIDDDAVVAQFYYELLNRTLSSNLKEPPLTKAKEEQIEMTWSSSDPIRKTYEDILYQLQNFEEFEVKGIHFSYHDDDDLFWWVTGADFRSFYYQCSGRNLDPKALSNWTKKNKIITKYENRTVKLGFMKKLNKDPEIILENLTSENKINNYTNISAATTTSATTNQLVLENFAMKMSETTLVVADTAHVAETKQEGDMGLTYKKHERQLEMGPQCIKLAKFPEGISKGGCYEVANLLLTNDDRHDYNVASYRNLVFEIDGIPLEEQELLIESRKNIIARAVYSGGKSIHCIIQVENAPENKEQYKWLWKRLNEQIFKGLADRACSNPARLTRCPNMIRYHEGNDSSKNDGNLQKLWFIQPISLQIEWEKEWQKVEDKKKEEEEIRNYLAMIHKSYGGEKCSLENLAQRNICQEAKDLINGNLRDGERHNKLPAAIGSLVACGRSYDEIEGLVKATGIKDWKTYSKFLMRKEISK
jgi:hypothetical protein